MAMRKGVYVKLAQTDAIDARLAQGAMVAHDVTGNPRKGIIPRSTAPLVTGSSTMAITVGSAVFVGSRGPADGAIVFSNDGPISTTLDAAPPANSRIDTVWVKHNDSTMGDPNDDPILGVTKGTALADPVPDPIPTGAVELAQVIVTANSTATNSLVINQTGRFTAMEGGTVLLRNSTEQAAWNPHEGSSGYRLDTNRRVTRRPGVAGALGWSEDSGTQPLASVEGATAIADSTNYKTLTTLSVTSAVARPVDVHLFFTAQATVNMAGNYQIVVNGVVIGSSLRLGNLNDATAPLPFTRLVQAELVAGVNTIEFRGRRDSSSGNWYANTPTLEVWNR